MQDRDIEIDQQSHVDPAQAQVSHQLRFVGGQNAFHRLEFDDDAIVNQQINAISAVRSASANATAPVI
jgi:hypothetical protein